MPLRKTYINNNSCTVGTKVSSHTKTNRTQTSVPTSVKNLSCMYVYLFRYRKLEIERGRFHNIPREDTLCKLCQQGVRI